MVIKSLLYNVLTLCILDELIFPSNFDNKGLFVAGAEGVWLVLLCMIACVLDFLDICMSFVCIIYIGSLLKPL